VNQNHGLLEHAGLVQCKTDMYILETSTATALSIFISSEKLGKHWLNGEFILQADFWLRLLIWMFLKDRFPGFWRFLTKVKLNYICHVWRFCKYNFYSTLRANCKHTETIIFFPGENWQNKQIHLTEGVVGATSTWTTQSNRSRSSLDLLFATYTVSSELMYFLMDCTWYIVLFMLGVYTCVCVFLFLVASH